MSTIEPQRRKGAEHQSTTTARRTEGDRAVSTWTPIKAEVHTSSYKGTTWYESFCGCTWDSCQSDDPAVVQAEVDEHNALEHDGFARVGDLVRTAHGYRRYIVASVDLPNDHVSLRDETTGRRLNRVYVDTLTIVRRAELVTA